MAEKRQSGFKKSFRKFRDSGKLKNFLVFLIFVCIAAVFWVIMALNDDVQNNYDVKLNIQNVPDSVTFISLPPQNIQVTLRDRGANLLRYRISGIPEVNVDFRDYSADGRFRISHSNLLSLVKRVFGSSSVISALSPDSLSLVYTDRPGVKVPLQLVYDVTPAPGMVLGTPRVSAGSVSLFSTTDADTVRRLLTDKIVLRNIDKTTTVNVPIKGIPGMRVVPSSIKVTFDVEQLIKKEADVPVSVDGLPIGYDILFFPSRVKVSYYVPMNRYADLSDDIKIEASFDEALRASSDKVGVRIVSVPTYVSNVELMQDSVEYTLVKGN